MKSETKTKIFTPQVTQEEPLKLDNELIAYPSKLPDIVKIRLKESAIASQIATGLYKSPRAGVRELYSNECRAARIARAKFKAYPVIEITVDQPQRQLSIQGRDSLGISAGVFVDVLRWMGRTTNDDATEVGQFGWGFFALWTLADSMRLETYARETDERYGVTASDAGAFIPIPDNEVTIQEYGTKVQLSLKKDVSIEDVIKWVETICRFSDVETHLIIPKHIVRSTSWGTESETHKAGQKRLDGTIKDKLRNHVMAKCAGDGVIYDVEIDNAEFYFYGATGGSDEHAHIPHPDEDTGICLLVRVPIERPKDAPRGLPFTQWVLDIKDERACPPTPDRDRFVDGALTQVIETVQKILKHRFAELNIKSLSDYRRAKWKGIYTCVNDASMFVDEQTRKLAILLAWTVICPKDPQIQESAETGYHYRHRCWGADRYQHRYQDACVFKHLRELVAGSDHLFYFSAPKCAKGTEIVPAKRMLLAKAVLRSKHNDAEVFMYSQGSEDSYHHPPDVTGFKRDLTTMGEVHFDTEREVEKIKAKLGHEWRRICGLPELRQKVALEECVVHKRWTDYRVESKRIPPKEVTSGTIRVPDHLSQYIDALNVVQSKYGVTRNHRDLKAGKIIGAFVDGIKHKTAPTNQGKPLSFEAILKTRGKLVIYLTAKGEVLDFYTAPDADVMVAVDGDEAFELMACLISNGRQYEAVRCPDDEAFSEKTGFGISDIVGDGEPDIDESRTITMTYLGACTIKTRELRELFLNAVKKALDAGEAQWLLDATHSIEAELKKSNSAASL